MSAVSRVAILAVIAVFGVAGADYAEEGAPATRISVDATKVENHITPWMTGSCIEDVNHEIYGGLYDQKLFGESFEEPPPAPRIEGWTRFGGDWTVDGEICRAASSAGGKLVLDAPNLADSAVEADIRLEDDRGENAGLVVRLGDPGVGADVFDGYEVSISARDQRLILGKHRHNWQSLQNVSAPVSAGAWHHLRVEMQGARIRIFLDDMSTPRIDFTDTDRPLLAGKIGLRSWNAAASFRNVRTQSTPSGQAAPAGFLLAADNVAVSGMWDAVRGGSAPASFAWDGTGAFNGQHAQKITRGEGDGLVGVANRGLNRWGIAVRKGQEYEGRIYLRGAAARGAMTVALQSADGATTYASARLQAVSPTWAQFPFRLKAAATDPTARFVIELDQPGTVWIDQAVLMDSPGDRFHGLPIRKDIAQALVDEKVTFLRYGGTMVNVPEYRWKNMIGDPDRRPPYRGNWYDYSTNGFGIFDFLNFCEAAHIEAAFAINIEETDTDAADLADYLTAPVSNPFGRRRAEDGHPAPYHVHYIEIGNEEVLGGDRGGEYQHYAERFRALSTAIHARNPDIPLVCAAWWRPESPSMRTVFDAVNGSGAAWDLHVDSDPAAAGLEVDRRLTEMQALFLKWDPRTTLKAVIFEENGGLHNVQRALGHATTIGASRRHGDFVVVDCPANCLQPLGQNDNGWDQGQVFFTPDRVWGMPPYFAQEMTVANYEPLRVDSSVMGSNDLDVLATRSDEGRTLVLSVVNTSSRAGDASIDLTGFDGVDGKAQVWTLDSGPTSDQPPTADGLRGAQPRTVTLGQPMTFRFPPMSYTVLRLTRAMNLVK